MYNKNPVQIRSRNVMYPKKLEELNTLQKLITSTFMTQYIKEDLILSR